MWLPGAYPLGVELGQRRHVDQQEPAEGGVGDDAAADHIAEGVLQYPDQRDQSKEAQRLQERQRHHREVERIVKNQCHFRSASPRRTR